MALNGSSLTLENALADVQDGDFPGMRLMREFFYLTGQGMETQGSQGEFVNAGYIHHAYLHARAQPAHAAIADVHLIFDWDYLNTLIHDCLQWYPFLEDNLRQLRNCFSAVSNLSRSPTNLTLIFL
jgi:hypothetical protein